MKRFRVINTLALAFVVTLITAVAALHARSTEEWQALVASVGGEDVITFRTKPGEDFLSSWTPEHLRDLRALEGVGEIFWRGGYSYAQGPASRYVLPMTTASPGFLSVRQATFVAGRDLSEEDAGRLRVILSKRHAREVFPDLAIDEVIGQHIQVLDERLEIIGIVAEADAAFRAALMPPLRYPGSYDAQDVYVRLAEPTAMASVVENVNAYLARTPELAVLEAVPYREFVRPGVINERLDYVREITRLFDWLIAFAILLAIVNLVNQSMFRAAAERRGWAVQRVLGASRLSLLARELTLGLRWEWLAIGSGGISGALLGIWLGGLATWPALLLGLAVGIVSLLLGSLPLVWGVLRLYPYQALRRSSGLVRHPLLAVSGALGLAVALALVVLAGGFRDLGRSAIVTEIEAIGADLVELTADRGSVLPVARITEQDVAELKAAFPQVPMTLLERHQGTLRFEDGTQEVNIFAADEAFVMVSGTRLAEGGWQHEGIILGSEVAERLFPDGDALGRTVTLEGQRFGRVELPVAAVAFAPSTERFATLQLAADAVLVSRAVLNTFSLRPWLYARVGALSAADVEALSALLSERYPDAAPFMVRYAAASFQAYLNRLEEQIRQFNLVAGLIFLLAAVGVATLAAVQASARRYRRGLERAFGATCSQVFQSELTSIIGVTLFVGSVGIGAGLLALASWTKLMNYLFMVPVFWLVTALLVTLGIGLFIGVWVARHSAFLSPMEVLGGEL